MNRTMNKIKTLKTLDISDFESIPKAKLYDFVSLIPDMSPEVAIEAIRQFPDFIKESKDIVIAFTDIIQKIFDSNDKDSIALYEVCNRILDDISMALENKNCSEKFKEYLVNRECEIAKIIAEHGHSKRLFMGNIVKTVGQVAAGVVVAAGTIIGFRKR